MSASAPLPTRMTAEAFILWATQQLEGSRYELIGGEIHGTAPEQVGHARGKFRVARRLADVIDVSQLPCEALIDGVPVRVDVDTVYEPDVLVQCGAPLDDDVTIITDPVIVVEVVSPSSHKRDSGRKLADCFRIPSVRHYLVIKANDKTAIHHRRDDSGDIATHIIRSGTLRLDPPGLEVTGLFDE